MKIHHHDHLSLLSLGKNVVIFGLDVSSANEEDNDIHNDVVKANKNNDHTLVEILILYSYRRL